MNVKSLEKRLVLACLDKGYFSKANCKIYTYDFETKKFSNSAKTEQPVTKMVELSKSFVVCGEEKGNIEVFDAINNEVITSS